MGATASSETAAAESWPALESERRPPALESERPRAKPPPKSSDIVDGLPLRSLQAPPRASWARHEEMRLCCLLD